MKSPPNSDSHLGMRFKWARSIVGKESRGAVSRSCQLIAYSSMRTRLLRRMLRILGPVSTEAYCSNRISTEIIAFERSSVCSVVSVVEENHAVVSTSSRVTTVSS